LRVGALVDIVRDAVAVGIHLALGTSGIVHDGPGGRARTVIRVIPHAVIVGVGHPGLPLGAAERIDCGARGSVGALIDIVADAVTVGVPLARGTSALIDRRTGRRVGTVVASVPDPVAVVVQNHRRDRTAHAIHLITLRRVGAGVHGVRNAVTVRIPLARGAAVVIDHGAGRSVVTDIVVVRHAVLVGVYRPPRIRVAVRHGWAPDDGRSQQCEGEQTPQAEDPVYGRIMHGIFLPQFTRWA
jgi:hypothetical protein